MGKAVVSKIYSHPEIDWVAQLSPTSKLEKIRDYWRRKVVATIDTLSGIITINVLAFKPKDAQELANEIIRRSEALVNEISERSRHDAVTRAQDEIDLMKTKLRAAQTELLNYRNKNSVVDPTASAASITQTMMQLLRDKLALEAQRASISGTVAPDSPTRRFLDSQIEAMDKQLASLQSQLTSQSSKDTISEKIAGYEDLQLDVQFLQRMYSLSQSIYERARAEQESQQLYIVTIVKPTYPEEIASPRLLLDTFLIFLSCLALWSMGCLAFASIIDHTN